LKSDPKPNEDLADDLELTADPISGDLEAYPESNDETDKLLASLKRERFTEKDGSKFPFGAWIESAWPLGHRKENYLH
jgi:hypothetical protein